MTSRQGNKRLDAIEEQGWKLHFILNRGSQTTWNVHMTHKETGEQVDVRVPVNNGTAPGPRTTRRLLDLMEGVVSVDVPRTRAHMLTHEVHLEQARQLKKARPDICISAEDIVQALNHLTKESTNTWDQWFSCVYELFTKSDHCPAHFQSWVIPDCGNEEEN